MIVRSNVSFEQTVGEYTVQMIIPVGVKFETVFGALEGFNKSLLEMQEQAKQREESSKAVSPDESPAATASSN